MPYYFECFHCSARIPIDEIDIGNHALNCNQCGEDICIECVCENGLCFECSELSESVETLEEVEEDV